MEKLIRLIIVFCLIVGTLVVGFDTAMAQEKPKKDISSGDSPSHPKSLVNRHIPSNFHVIMEEDDTQGSSTSGK